MLVLMKFLRHELPAIDLAEPEGTTLSGLTVERWDFPIRS